MIAVCPHCSADIVVDATQDSSILTCPSCSQQSEFENPFLPLPPTSPRQAKNQIPVASPFHQSFRPGWRIFLLLLWAGAFVTGVLLLEPWLDENQTLSQQLIPAGRFYVVAIHFPLVIVSIIFLTELLLALRKTAMTHFGFRYWWWCATISGGLAFPLSVLLARDPSLAMDADSALTHRTFALIMVATLFVTLLVKIITDAKPGRSQALYRLLTTASLLIILFTAYLGLGLVLGDEYLFQQPALPAAAP
jgi:uncharacterized membrane protein